MENFLNFNNLLINNYWTTLIVLSLIFVFLLIFLLFISKNNELSNNNKGETDNLNNENDINSEQPSEELNMEKNKNKKWLTVILSIFLVIIGLCIMAMMFFALINNKNGDVNLKDKNGTGSSGEIHYLGILPLENPSTMLEKFAGVEKYLRDKNDGSHNQRHCKTECE